MSLRLHIGEIRAAGRLTLPGQRSRHGSDDPSCKPSRFAPTNLRLPFLTCDYRQSDCGKGALKPQSCSPASGSDVTFVIVS